MYYFEQTSSRSLFLREFLIEPRYRMARHCLLIFILVVTALNQSFMSLRAGMEVLGNGMFLQAAFIFITYLGICYFNLWVLLPRYLLKKKYLPYILCLAAAILLLIVMQTMEERTILLHIGKLDEFYTFPRIFLTIVSSFAVVLLCVSGGAITILLRQWMTDNEKVNRLEKLRIQSEVEQLKEQVNPHLLFHILNRTGTLATRQPGKASDMLIRLSQLLRYQLYDCNRENVLLSTEIKFLNDYLILEQMYSDSFEFDIRWDEGCSHTLVSPLLFISFVQPAVMDLHERSRKASLYMGFETADSRITFVCRCDTEDLFLNKDFSKISKRLELLYKNRHALAIGDKEIVLKLETETNG